VVATSIYCHSDRVGAQGLDRKGRLVNSLAAQGLHVGGLGLE
jgi:hypothetical protein